MACLLVACGEDSRPTDSSVGPGDSPTPLNTASPSPAETPLEPSPSPTQTPEIDTPQPAYSRILSVEKNPFAPLSRTFSVESDDGSDVVLFCDEHLESGQKGERHLASIPPEKQGSFTLYGLKAITTYDCYTARQAFFDPTTFTTDSLPDTLATFQVTVPSADPTTTGYTLFGEGYQIDWGGSNYLYENDYTVIVGPFGNIRWYMNTYSTGALDITFLGDDLYGEPTILWGGEGGVYVPPTIRNLNGVDFFVGTDEVVSPDERKGQWHHDCGLSADRGSVFALVNESLPPDGVELDDWYGFVVKQIDLESNTNLWWWDSWADGTEAGRLEECTSSSAYYPDCFHANSVFDNWEIDPETGEEKLYVYLGFRHRSRVMKIDYLTKEVVWRLGPDETDFTLLEADGTPADSTRWFYSQHDARRYGDLITVYDNGYARQYAGGMFYSRVVELELDETAGTARLVFEYDQADLDTMETDWMERVWGGFVHLDNGERLVARGHSNASAFADDNGNSAIFTLAPGDEPIITWRIDFDSELTAIYRADHIDACQLFHNADVCPDFLSLVPSADSKSGSRPSLERGE